MEDGKPYQYSATGEDVASTAVPHSSAPSKNRNACTVTFTTHNPLSYTADTVSLVTALMAQKSVKTKSPPSSTPDSDPARNTVFLHRDGLGAYISDPSSFPSSRVIYHNDDFVVINDLFPKSTLHLLLLPRNPEKMLLHPYDAFTDPTFCASVQEEVAKLRSLVAKELKRKLARDSKKEQERGAAMENEAEGEGQLPEGRDWGKEVISGIHAEPSMNHLHVHVMSREMHSECMRHRKHYNSFQTPFLVPVEDFPLEGEDERKKYRQQRFLDRDLVCWRCGANFGNKFKRLKGHLESEYEEWRKE